jgi:hypothetical protein
MFMFPVFTAALKSSPATFYSTHIYDAFLLSQIKSYLALLIAFWFGHQVELSCHRPQLSDLNTPSSALLEILQF